MGKESIISFFNGEENGVGSVSRVPTRNEMEIALWKIAMDSRRRWKSQKTPIGTKQKEKRIEINALKTLGAVKKDSEISDLLERVEALETSLG
ncbi:hypothetical protein CL673_08270 [Candidatus Bathyarchaeota archaeon]|nr:hypothetical protein [Candidatus Bathyarchaeota archaeon]MDP6048858.1 hypothetical protein [Candidatus Bathyarchaeota archaeon]MDP7207775.1 hypothetical protein [Candidatus Bathyarchaeota archaeon]